MFWNNWQKNIEVSGLLGSDLSIVNEVLPLFFVCIFCAVFFWCGEDVFNAVDSFFRVDVML